MAAAVQTTAATIEEQLLEVAMKIQLLEKADTTNNPNNVQITPDVENGTISITFTAPATFAVSSAGKVVFSPTPYLA